MEKYVVFGFYTRPASLGIQVLNGRAEEPFVSVPIEAKNGQEAIDQFFERMMQDYKTDTEVLMAEIDRDDSDEINFPIPIMPARKDEWVAETAEYYKYMLAVAS